MLEDTHLRSCASCNPPSDLTQRELADKLDMSVGGGLNSCLDALINKGLVKIQSFSNNENKFNYVYLLTPMGIVE